uniref:Uncharacterized protein n=1 Tax=Vespula pensylvanica TaxID=30213 RepID=A0A834KM26_VESPE|nr:hypothetical protein H0235_014065 [Vespula pensylvanica]
MGEIKERKIKDETDEIEDDVIDVLGFRDDLLNRPKAGLEAVVGAADSERRSLSRSSVPSFTFRVRMAGRRRQGRYGSSCIPSSALFYEKEIEEIEEIQEIEEIEDIEDIEEEEEEEEESHEMP